MSTSAIDTHEEVEAVLARLDELIPLFAANAAETERRREPVRENIEALEECGFFRLGYGTRFGGLEASVGAQNDALRLIARGCPSTSWVAAVLQACTWWIGCCDDRLQDEFFASREQPRATAITAPTGKGVREDGGLRVNGRWAFNTGNAHAHWATLGILAEESDGSVTPMIGTIPYEDIERIDDWHAFGMAGSGSNSIAVTDAFVPDHRLVPVARAIARDYRTEREASNPYFQKPLVPRFIVASIGTLLGIAEGAFDAFLERLPGRSITYSNYSDQSAAPITHHQVAEAALTIDSIRHHCDIASRMVDGWGLDEPGNAARFKARAHAGYATRLTEEAVRILFHASGATAIQHDVPIQRYHRDAQALANHAYLLPTTQLEFYGQALVGREPETPFM